MGFAAKFINTYRSIPSHCRRLPEQKMILALSIATIGFNDPFYIVTLMSPNSTT